MRFWPCFPYRNADRDCEGGRCSIAIAIVAYEQMKGVPMTQQPIRFVDGAAYERMMGAWSLLAGDVFLDWLAPRQNLKWIDVGCGNGAFTQLIVAKTAPAEVQGIDPSDGQLEYARKRRGTAMVQFHKG